MHIMLYLLLCLIAAIIGSNRFLGFWGFLLLSILVTPIVSFAILALATSKKRKQARAGG